MTASDADITNCDREPIHLLGAVQSFGFLLTVTSDWRIGHASANLADHLDLTPDAAFGRPLDDVLLANATHAIRGSLQAMASPEAVERIFNLALQPGRRFDLAIHRSGSWVIIEAEPSVDENMFDAASSTRTMIARLQRPATVLELCQEAARQVRALTGFDRVMIYRFDEDGSGEVVAERAQSILESYLGLHYPATDIPRQARALYLRNTLRLIADVNDRGIQIESAPGTAPDPLDLSLSVLRAVSPIHLEYLRNMGVAASMSISVLQQGALWGLIVCHHGQPRHLSLNLRTTAELFGQMFSFLMESRQRDLDLVQERFRREQHDRLIASISIDDSVFDAIGGVIGEMRTMIGCDSFAMIIDDRIRTCGRVPDDATLRALGQFVAEVSPGAIFTTNHLASQFAPAATFDLHAAGVLAIPILGRAKNYLYFFRDPWNHSREWAGDPSKVVRTGDSGELRPRASFEAWTEQVRGQSKKWTVDDVRVAEHLRVSLREVIFKQSDSMNLARLEASAKQDVLIAELNHRVRNILGLVRGMVSQSHDGVAHVEEFIESVSGRIHALARAHDQITTEQWCAAPLRKLIEAEAMAYLMPGHDRLVMTGPGVLLDPYSFPTVALVIHELMTNSAKYGALSVLSGQIVVKWSIDDTGSLVIRWEERGGPLVREPARRGFGSTIIDRSIPFDLKGTSRTEYASSGLRASFVIPAAYICVSEESQGVVATHREVKLSQLHGDVLVLEDNLIIALDAEDILIRLGAGRVHTASTVREAMHIVSNVPITFALLDYNLGDETSLEVALLLQANGTPFLFASGYGELLRLPIALRDARVIRKPYSLESLREIDA